MAARFYRAIPLPEGVKPETAKADDNNGVLEIAIEAPQPRDTRARRVEITHGEGQPGKTSTQQAQQASTTAQQPQQKQEQQQQVAQKEPVGSHACTATTEKVEGAEDNAEGGTQNSTFFLLRCAF